MAADQKKLKADPTVSMLTYSPSRSSALVTRYVSALNRKQNITSDQELVEYAGALVAVGAPTEAERLLDRTTSPSEYDVLCIRFQVARSTWNWAPIVPLLEKWLSIRAHLTDTPESLEIRLCLGASLLHETRSGPESEQLLIDVLNHARRLGFTTVQANALSLLVHHRIGARDWAGAKTYLQDFESLCRELQHPVAELRLREWTHLIALAESSERSTSFQNLSAIQKDYRDLGYWELGRNCEYLTGFVLRDPELLLRTYFGSPHAALKNRIRRDLAEIGCEVPEFFDFELQGGPDTPFSIDQASGENSLNGRGLKPGQVQQRLLTALSRDLYRPRRLQDLHSEVFPGEHFNPRSSTARMLRSLQRLRDWLAGGQLPLKIESDRRGGYRLVASAHCRIRVYDTSLDNHAISPQILRWIEKMSKVFGQRDNGFTPIEIITQFNTPSRTVSRRLQAAVDFKFLERIGKGRGTRYRFAADRSARTA